MIFRESTHVIKSSPDRKENKFKFDHKETAHTILFPDVLSFPGKYPKKIGDEAPVQYTHVNEGFFCNFL